MITGRIERIGNDFRHRRGSRAKKAEIYIHDMFFLRWALCATGQPTLRQHIDAIDAAIGQIDQEGDTHVEPFRTAIEILSSIPSAPRTKGSYLQAQFRRPS